MSDDRRKLISRRTFLRGAGGIAVSLPILSSLVPDAIGAGGTSTFPQRFIFIIHPNGTIQDAFWPTAGADETDFTLGPILEPLSDFKDKLLILEGLDLEAGTVGPGEPHQTGMGGILTGRPLQEGNFRGGDGSLAGWGDGVSVDQAIANHIGTDNVHKSLHLGVRADTSAGSEVRSRISYSGPAQPLPPQNDPVQVFDMLFGDMMTDDDTLRIIRDQRLSVLDSVSKQMRSIQNRVSHSDRERLDQHMTMLRDLEISLQNEKLDEGDASCKPPLQPPDQEADSEDTMPDIAKLQIDLMVTAMACDLTRVSTLQISNAKNHIRFPWVQSTGDGLSHAGPSNTQARNERIARHNWIAEKIAYLLQRLDSIPETGPNGDGTMLDNTVVWWTSEIAQGNTHSQRNLPTLLAGSAGGHFQTGRYIKFDEHKPHNDLLVSLLHAFGLQNSSFGDERFCNGPLLGA